MGQQGFSSRLVKHFGQGGFHPGAFAGGQDDGLFFHGVTLYNERAATLRSLPFLLYCDH
ncbi:MAG: hypothetical protein SCM88_10865 [Bacillota bacterium]|nr:hypothetical protein [Bacillota bacterium]